MEHHYPNELFVDLKFLCPLCEHVMNDPTQCQEGHMFCRTCILQHINSIPDCPTCKMHLSVDRLSLSLFVKTEIGKLQVRCRSTLTNRDELSCTWTSTLNDVDDHCSQCEFISINCQNDGCDKRVQRRHVDCHDLECAHKLLSCEFCGLYLKRSALDDHKSMICRRRPIECPNRCNVTVPLDELNEHISVTCPLEEIDCPYSLLQCSGSCPGRLMRRDLDAHLEALETMKARILALDQKATQLAAALTETEKKTIEKEINVKINIDEERQAKESALKQLAEVKASKKQLLYFVVFPVVLLFLAHLLATCMGVGPTVTSSLLLTKNDSYPQGDRVLCRSMTPQEQEKFAIIALQEAVELTTRREELDIIVDRINDNQNQPSVSKHEGEEIEEEEEDKEDNEEDDEEETNSENTEKDDEDGIALWQQDAAVVAPLNTVPTVLRALTAATSALQGGDGTQSTPDSVDLAVRVCEGIVALVYTNASNQQALGEGGACALVAEVLKAGVLEEGVVVQALSAVNSLSRDRTTTGLDAVGTAGAAVNFENTEKFSHFGACEGDTEQFFLCFQRAL